MAILRILILTIGLIAGLHAASTRTFAQNPPSPDALQAAKELVSVISAVLLKDLTTRRAAEAWPQVEAALRAANSNIDPATLAELRLEFDRVQTYYFIQVTNDAPAIYARYFTAQEMRAITAFYQTPVGSKTLAVMPQAMNEFFAALGPRLQESAVQIQRSFAEILKKKGYTP
jgi:hypothetical protein